MAAVGEANRALVCPHSTRTGYSGETVGWLNGSSEKSFSQNVRSWTQDVFFQRCWLRGQ